MLLIDVSHETIHNECNRTAMHHERENTFASVCAIESGDCGDTLDGENDANIIGANTVRQKMFIVVNTLANQLTQRLKLRPLQWRVVHSLCDSSR